MACFIIPINAKRIIMALQLLIYLSRNNSSFGQYMGNDKNMGYIWEAQHFLPSNKLYRT
jgi:hypothetical protein